MKDHPLQGCGRRDSATPTIKHSTLRLQRYCVTVNDCVLPEPLVPAFVPEYVAVTGYVPVGTFALAVTEAAPFTSEARPITIEPEENVTVPPGA